MCDLADMRYDNGELPHPPSRRDIFDQKIVDWLLKMQLRGLKTDEHWGLMTTKDIAMAIGLTKKDMRPHLERLQAAGRITKTIYHGGDFRWRTNNPLPWERKRDVQA